MIKISKLQNKNVLQYLDDEDFTQALAEGNNLFVRGGKRLLVIQPYILRDELEEYEGVVFQLDKKNKPTLATEEGDVLFALNEWIDLQASKRAEKVVLDIKAIKDEKYISRLNLNAIRAEVKYAFYKHLNQYRRGTRMPYVEHLIAVMNILIDNKCASVAVEAGILHDVLEDTDATAENLAVCFGDEVAKIVCEVSEDKSLTWVDRKLKLIDSLLSASIEAKQVACANNLNNIKSMYAELSFMGNRLWSYFNGTKEQTGFVFLRLVKNLEALKGYTMYNELVACVKRVFGE